MNIELNIDDLIQEFNLPANIADTIVEAAVEEVTLEVYRNWSLQASKGLNSTRQAYINGLETINSGKFSRVIRLNGQFNNMLENGASAFDMKEGFRKSNKVKFSSKIDKNGTLIQSWYLTIPFRHGVPTTIGENPAFANVMPQEIYDIIKNYAPKKGLKNADIPAPYNQSGSRESIARISSGIMLNPVATDIPEYKHKNSIYDGLTKQTAAYEKTTQNTYVSFRRVGENSDANSWIHKGISAHRFLDKAIAATDFSMIAENSVDKSLKSLGYGV